MVPMKRSLQRVLFVYPNSGSLRIPLAVAILAAQLRQRGVEVEVIDTTFTRIEQCSDYALMESRGVVKKSRLETLLGEPAAIDVGEEIRQTVTSFAPDVILFSVIERHYWLFDLLARRCKEVAPETPIIVGGILATIYPSILLEHPCVDYVVYGEGETFMDELADSFADPDRFRTTRNLMFRTPEGNVVRNPLAPLTNMDEVPFQEWEGFDIRQLLKPYEGNVWIGGSFEFSRGCFKRCAFCVAPQLRKSYGPEEARRYHRTKSPERAIAEIREKKERYSLTFLAMCDTDFLLGVPDEVVEEFCRLYKKEIGIPWIIQSSAESFTERKLAAIVQAGCVSASIGVESGSPRMRKQVLKKDVPLETVKRAFDLCRDHNFRTTANYMIGLPYETEEDVWETIRFNRFLNPPSVAITYFTPFLGTELYDVCVREGFYPAFDPRQNVYRHSPLTMPTLSPRRIDELIATFMEEFEGFKKDVVNIHPRIIEENNSLVDRIYR